MASYATRAATITRRHFLEEIDSHFGIVPQLRKMTNGEIGSDSPEAAKKYLQDIIKRVDGLQAIVITDRDGIPIVRVNTPDTPDTVSKPNFLASISLAIEQAGKLGSGKNRRIICMFDTFQLVHFNKSPLMVSLVATARANTGLLLNIENELSGFIQDLQFAINASNQ